MASTPRRSVSTKKRPSSLHGECQQARLGTRGKPWPRGWRGAEHSFNRQCRWYKTPRAAGSANLVLLDERRTLLACLEPPLPPGLSFAGLSCALAATAPDGWGQEAGAGARATTFVATPGPRGGEWKRAFNPFRDDTDTRWPATAGVYEPLLVYSRATRSYVPWLATGYQWGAGNLTVRFTHPPGVVWSDGQPFSGKDVAFTFDLMRRFSALDRAGVWGFLADVKSARRGRASSSRSSAPTRPGSSPSARSPSSPSTSGRTWPSPRHSTTRARWAPVPSRRCVASSPPSTSWARIRSTGRRTSSKVLGPARAALSQQRGDPARPRGRRAGLGVALRATTSRSAGWPRTPRATSTGTRTSGRPRSSSSTPDDTPFDDTSVRKAVSMALDRPRIMREALNGYAPPADATGLAESQKPVEGRGARQGWRLDAPGRGPGQRAPRRGRARPRRGRRPLGSRRGPDALRPRGRGGLVGLGHGRGHHPPEPGRGRHRGHRQGAALRRLGGRPASAGDSTWGCGSGSAGPLPTSSTEPDGLGARASRSARRRSPTSTASRARTRAALLRRFEASSDPAEQLRLGRELQKIYVDYAPSLPLFASPLWGVFNAGRLTGFPSRFSPYAGSSPGLHSDNLQVLLAVKPR